MILAKIRGKTLNLIVRKTLNFIKKLFKSRDNSSPTDHYIELLKNSGIISNKNIKTFNFMSLWDSTSDLWKNGSYIQATKIRREVLEELYANQGATGKDYYPPFVSSQFLEAFGHFGILAAHLHGTKVGLLPAGKRYALTNSRQIQNQMIGSIFKEYNAIPSEGGSTFLELPISWHMTERLQMFKGRDNFIEQYEYLELLYSTCRIDKRSPIETLDSEYEMTIEQELQQMGIPKGAWFAGLHLRESSNPNDARVASKENFYPALMEIISRGGWIIRFGAGLHNPVMKHERIIELDISTRNHLNFHPYILANAEFLLTTQGGPVTHAWAYGTPVIQTNTVGIGRNILSASTGSLALPKHYFRNGIQMSLSEILVSREAYSDTDLSHKKRQGITLKQNTPDEIREAVVEFLESRDSKSDEGTLNQRVNQIRNSTGAIGYGRISNSFLHTHEKWFIH